MKLTFSDAITLSVAILCPIFLAMKDPALFTIGIVLVSIHSLRLIHQL
jgi:hypothetical protein